MQVLSSVTNKSIIVLYYYTRMDNLLCDEVMSPMQENDDGGGFNPKRNRENSSILLPIQDCEEALSIYLGNESGFMPEPGYLKLLETDELVRTARFKALIFIIKTQRRMDLPVEIVFTAANYLDRFISLGQCQGWKCWTFELLSVACLTVASKFNGTASNFQNEFQVNDDLENSFGPKAIQDMELKLMTALGWRMNSTTPFSYIHLLLQRIDHDSLNGVTVEDLTQRVTELLLNALLDPNLVEFKQSVIVTSAIKCLVDGDLSESGIIPQEQKDNAIKCLGIMEQVSGLGCGSYWAGPPSSPVTVLKEELFYCVDVETKSSRKRKMDERGCIDI